MKVITGERLDVTMRREGADLFEIRIESDVSDPDDAGPFMALANRWNIERFVAFWESSYGNSALRR
jgi:hypothetical protein